MMKSNSKHKHIFLKSIGIIFLCLLIIILFLIDKNVFFGINTKTIYSFWGINEFSWKSDNYPLSVHFIDVGCGDCILIKCNNKTALIDTGNLTESGKAKYYLEHNGIEKLNLFIASHTDSDHIGDFSSIADNFKVDEIWISQFCIPDSGNQTEYEKTLFSNISEKNIKIVFPNIQQSYFLGDAELKVLSPTRKYNTRNDNSLVIKLIYKNVSFLFTGDAGEDVETTLLENNSDIGSTVLKLAHHGSKSATTQEFINAVSPKYAVISAGDENKYLPNRTVVKRVEDFGCEILRTDINGSIIIATDGNDIKTFKEIL